MKHIFLSMMLLMGLGISYAGNGNPPCDCGSPNQVDIYATGVAEMVGAYQVKCTGETGKCWEVTLKPGGGWSLDIFTEPPQHWGNSNGPENPPAGPSVVSQTADYKIYEWDSNVWKK